MAKTTKSFEDSMADLESLVESLENGELSLDESLALFEKGIKISRQCQKVLDNAEQKVKKLSGEQWVEME